MGCHPTNGVKAFKETQTTTLGPTSDLISSYLPFTTGLLMDEAFIQASTAKSSNQRIN